MASPAGFAYRSLAGIEQYARPGALVVVAQWLIDDARVRAVAEAGGTVAMYVGFMEGPTSYSSPEQARLYGGAPPPDRYLWQPRRSNFSSTVMTDVRRDSEWGRHVVEDYAPTVRARLPHVSRIFADVYGERLWSPAWASMSATERAVWAEGMRYWLSPLRTAFGLPIIVNGTWAQGNLDAAGACIENHGAHEIPYWRDYLAKSWGGSDHVVITRSSGDVSRWAAVPGVRWVALDTSNYGQVGPVWGPFDPGDAPTPAPPPSTVALPKAPPAPTVITGDGFVTVHRPAFPEGEQVFAWQAYANDQNGPPSDLDVPVRDDRVDIPAPNGVPRAYRTGGRNQAGFGPWSPSVTVAAQAPPAPEPAPTPEPEPPADDGATLARVREAVAAETQRHATAIADALEG